MILPKGFNLRRMDESDKRFLWEINNDPETRRQSFSMEKISWEEHQKWFDEKLKEKQFFMYVLEHEGKRVAQSDFHLNEGVATAAVVVAPEQRGKSYGAMVIKLGIEMLRQECRIHRVIAFIKKDNTASVAAFEKCGFEFVEMQKQRGYDCLRMEYSL